MAKKKKITAGMLGVKKAVKKKTPEEIEKAVSHIHQPAAAEPAIEKVIPVPEPPKADPAPKKAVSKPKSKKEAAKAQKTDSRSKTKDPEKIVRVSFNMTKDLHRKIKIKALMSDITIQDLMVELSEKYLREK